jgi:hypothetical protein
MAENEEVIGDQPDEGPDGEQISGTDDLLYALADALRLKKSKEALASLIEKYANEIPLNGTRRHKAMLWSYGFTVVVIAGVGALGHLRVITSETAGTLLGAIIGALFYGRRK